MRPSARVLRFPLGNSERKAPNPDFQEAEHTMSVLPTPIAGSVAHKSIFHFEEDYRLLFNTMADFLQAAVADARKLTRSLYHPLFGVWHHPNKSGRCEICLAGTFIAGTLRFSSCQFIDITNISGPVSDLLMALDCMRTGDWAVAFYKYYSRNPHPDTELKLYELPAPRCRCFTNWTGFDIHLTSLDAVIPLLREIEQQEPLDQVRNSS